MESTQVLGTVRALELHPWIPVSTLAARHSAKETAAVNHVDQ